MRRFDNLVEGQLAPQDFVSNVWVPLTQNVLGGFGAGVLVGTVVAVLLTKAFNMDVLEALKTAAIVAGITALLVVSFATFIRNFRDEFQAFIAMWAQAHDRATQEALRAEIRKLQGQVVELQQHGRVLGRYERLAVAERMLREAYLLSLKITREACAERGYTDPEWDNAHALLLKAGVIDRRSTIRVATFDLAWGMVVREDAKKSGRYLVDSTGQLVRDIPLPREEDSGEGK